MVKDDDYPGPSILKAIGCGALVFGIAVVVTIVFLTVGIWAIVGLLTSGPSGYDIAARIAAEHPELGQRATFHPDWLDGDEVDVYLKAGIALREAEGAYCSLVAPAAEKSPNFVLVWLDEGRGALLPPSTC